MKGIIIGFIGWTISGVSAFVVGVVAAVDAQLVDLSDREAEALLEAAMAVLGGATDSQIAWRYWGPILVIAAFSPIGRTLAALVHRGGDHLFDRLEDMRHHRSTRPSRPISGEYSPRQRAEAERREAAIARKHKQESDT